MTKRRGNGEGSICRHPKRDLWMARYTVETPSGTKRRTVYGGTRAKVRDKLARAVADRADGVVFDDGNMTVGEYLERWLSDCVRGSVRESTFTRDKYLVTKGNYIPDSPRCGILLVWKTLQISRKHSSKPSCISPISKSPRSMSPLLAGPRVPFAPLAGW